MLTCVLNCIVPFQIIYQHTDKSQKYCNTRQRIEIYFLRYITPTSKLQRLRRAELWAPGGSGITVGCKYLAGWRREGQMELSPAGRSRRKEVPVSLALPALSGFSSSTFTVADVNQKRTAAPREETSTGLEQRELAAATHPSHGSAQRWAHSALLCGSPACSLSVLADRELMQPKAVNRGFTANISYHDLA